MLTAWTNFSSLLARVRTPSSPKREREKERERESEKEGERERERKYLFLKGIDGCLGTF